MSQEKNILDLIVPDVGDFEQIELVRWNVKVGDILEEGFEICELVCNKASFQIEAPYKCQIIKIEKDANTNVKVGEKLLQIKKI